MKKLEYTRLFLPVVLYGCETSVFKGGTWTEGV
jgi:hypothetical protein